MDFRRLPTRDTPRIVTAELTRYAGINPHGEPLFRVVLAQNVREQSFGTMRHMPVVDVDLIADDEPVEPEAFSAGEFLLPRYDSSGWILERWFPAHAWGDQYDWEHELAEDGMTRLKGEFPRQGDYFMVNEEFHVEPMPMEFWKAEIQKCLRSQEAQSGDYAAILTRNLYLHRMRQENKAEDYRELVNHLHRTVTDPTLATIGRTAQLVRDEIREQQGIEFHLAAG